MNEEIKKRILEKYQRELHRGERFWPDSIFRDAIVALGIFILLIFLATFVGVPVEPKADPSDTTYVPRPEWYFLFLFKFLALYGQIPVLGKIEWLATVLVPTIAIGVLFFLPFIDRSPYRHYSKRVLPISVMAIVVVSMITLTLIANVPTVSPEGPTLATALQPISGLVIPGLALLLLFIMGLAFKNTPTSAMVWVTVVASGLMVVLTGVILVAAPAPEVEETQVATTLPEQIVAGQDLYSVYCVECHGDDGKVTVIEGVEGLEGTTVSPINSTDVLYTFTDDTLKNIIAYGQQGLGMPPFGKAYGGELSTSEIDYIITFMRYAWDDRFEMPPIKPLFPPLAEGEVPSYEVHIAPIVKRYCVSCHRPGKDNNDYLMTSYEEILTSGQHADKNIVAGDMDSYLLQVIQGTPILDENGQEIIGVMPPKSTLQPDVVDVWTRWIMNGMPETAEEAASLSTTPVPEETPAP